MWMRADSMGILASSDTTGEFQFQYRTGDTHALWRYPLSLHWLAPRSCHPAIHRHCSGEYTLPSVKAIPLVRAGGTSTGSHDCTSNGCRGLLAAYLLRGSQQMAG